MRMPLPRDTYILCRASELEVAIIPVKCQALRAFNLRVFLRSSLSAK